MSHHHSQADVATYLGLTRSGYNHIENGVRGLDVSLLIKLCKLYNTSADYLLGLDTTTVQQPKQEHSELVKIINALPKDCQERIMGYIDAIVDSCIA